MEAQDAVASVRESVRDYLRRSQDKLRVRGTSALPEKFERAAWRELAALGLQAAVVTEGAGGLGLEFAAVSAIAQELGAFLVPEPYVASGIGVGKLLEALPRSDRRDALLQQFVAGDLVAGIAWQEAAGEIEPAPGACTLRAEQGRSRLHGCKKFVVPGRGADGWIVLARCGNEPVLVWVDAQGAEAAIEDEPRVDGTAMTSLRFDGTAVAAADVLAKGRAAIDAVRASLDWMRIGQAAELVGLARRAMEIMLEYLRTRVQFGKPIGSFQALKHRAVDAQLALEMAASVLDEAIATVAAQPEQLAREASRAKARASASALQLTRFAIQCHGAMGITDECDIGLFFKRAMGISTWLGNATRHRRRYLQLRPRVQAAAATAQAPMDFPHDADWEAMPEPQFRAMVRAFAEQHCPRELLHLSGSVPWKLYKPWFMALSQQGWVAPAWPKEHGGMGLSPGKLMAYFEELENHGVPRSADFGITMIGPLLIRHGTPAQQAAIIPAILRGEIVWAQGYSEPGAGSDLASLRTEARLDGDHFVVNGQKIWNGHANSASHMFMLVRTDKGGRKQEGISFLLVDLATPGITVRPILDINGDRKLCECFFDDVRVPVANIVGQMHQGWGLAKSLLGFERLYLGSPKQAQAALAKLLAANEQLALDSDPAFAARLAECTLDVRDAAALYRSYAEIFRAGKPLPNGVALLKIAATETYQRVATLLVEALDETGGRYGEGGHDAAGVLLTSLPSSIYGGSNEIQRNIVAKAVLDLPD